MAIMLATIKALLLINQGLFQTDASWPHHPSMPWRC
jgi:hypothetical protein